MNYVEIEKVFEEAYENKLKSVEAEYQRKIANLEQQLKACSLAKSTNPFEDSAKVELSQHVAIVEQELSAVKAQLVTAITDRNTVEAKRKAAWKKYDNLEAQMAGLRENHKKEKAGLVVDIEERDKVIKQQSDIIEQLTRTNNDLKYDIIGHEQMITSMEDTHGIEMAQLEAKYRNFEVMYKKLMSAHEANVAKVEQINKQLENEMVLHVSTKNELAKVKDAYDEMNNNYNFIHNENLNLRQACATRDQEIQNLRYQLQYANNARGILSNFMPFNINMKCNSSTTSINNKNITIHTNSDLNAKVESRGSTFDLFTRVFGYSPKISALVVSPSLVTIFNYEGVEIISRKQFTIDVVNNIKQISCKQTLSDGVTRDIEVSNEDYNMIDQILNNRASMIVDSIIIY